MAKNLPIFFHFLLVITYLSTILSGHVGSAQEGSVSPARRDELAILDTLFQNYDKRMIPGGNQNGSQPTYVVVNMKVRSIQSIDDFKMETGMELNFRQQWVDSRLAFKPPRSNPELAYLNLLDTGRAWTPDIFFSNEKEGHFHDFPQRNQYIRIFPNGEVLLNQRISLTTSCPMSLKYYPLDKHICSIWMSSYGYTTKDIIFQWKSMDPIQMLNKMPLPRFSLQKFTTDYCDSQSQTGVYSCLRADFHFKRTFSYYLVQVYIPLCNLVIVAWFAFWLDAKSSLMPRVGVGLFALGLMFAVVISGNATTHPPTSYTKAIDVWTGVCLTFVFFALAETIVASRWARSDSCGGQQQKSDEVDLPAVSLKGKWQRYWKSVGGCSNKLDFIVRILYPLAFILFLVMYNCAFNRRNEDEG